MGLIGLDGEVNLLLAILDVFVRGVCGWEWMWKQELINWDFGLGYKQGSSYVYG